MVQPYGSTVVAWHGMAIRDAEGTPIRMLGAHTDLTQQKLSEQKFQQSLADLDTLYNETKLALEQSEQIFEHSPDAILQVNSAGSIIKANKQATELFGYQQTELIQLNLKKLIPSETRKHHDQYLQHYFAVGGARKMGSDRGKLTAIRKDGESITVEITLNLINTLDGKQALATIRDVREKEQLIDSLTLQIEENKKLERFAFVASHDLQEPLRKVNAFTEIIEQRFEALNIEDEQAQFSFSRLKTASDNMRSMINNTLKLSKINAASIALTDCNIHKNIEQAIQNLQSYITDHQAHITVTGGECTVYADAGLLVQLFQNLISNAIKFQQPEQPPIISIKTIEERNVTKVLISDNGIGIEPQYHDNIFEPFKRLHTKEAYRGNGIGLAICKQIMDIHQGTITCESEENKGTTFTVSLYQDPS